MKKNQFIFALALTLGFALSFTPALADYVAPKELPPTCSLGDPGCAPPVDVSLSPQVKQGGLGVNGLFRSIRGIIANSNPSASVVGTFPQGAIGAASYCDENGANCKTITNIAGVDTSGINNCTEVTKKVIWSGAPDNKFICADDLNDGQGPPASPADWKVSGNNMSSIPTGYVFVGGGNQFPIRGNADFVVEGDGNSAGNTGIGSAGYFRNTFSGTSRNAIGLIIQNDASQGRSLAVVTPPVGSGITVGSDLASDEVVISDKLNDANGVAAIRVSDGAGPVVIGNSGLTLGGVTHTLWPATDNLGDHMARQNIRLNNPGARKSFYISGDGSDGGLSITDSGNANFSSNLVVNGRLGFTANGGLMNYYNSPDITGNTDPIGNGTKFTFCALGKVVFGASGGTCDINKKATGEWSISVSGTNAKCEVTCF